MVIPKILELLFSNTDRALWGEDPDRLKNESFFGDQINHHHHEHLHHVHLWVRDAHRNESLHSHPHRAVHRHCQADLKEARWDLEFWNLGPQPWCTLTTRKSTHRCARLTSITWLTCITCITCITLINLNTLIGLMTFITFITCITSITCITYINCIARLTCIICNTWTTCITCIECIE